MPRDRGPRDDQQQHPVLSDDEDAAQRGDDPDGSFGHTDPPTGDLDPGWQPDNGVRDAAETLIKEIGGEHRPRREDVYPYLLVRAYSPGDRGARPTWPTTPCWESPDILLVDATYTGEFSFSRLVASPTAGRRYRVFVRVWNLGLLPGVGVHVRAWFVNPGFFGGDPGNPAYAPQEIGGAMLTQLDDRTKPGAMQLVELDQTWDIPPDLTGHECLVASVSCPLDPWTGTLDANHDRHVGQRNVVILTGADDTEQLMATLAERVTETGTLELWHGGAAVTPLLQGLLGRTKTVFGTAARLRAPLPGELRHGVPTANGQHLLTMFRTPKGWLVADSARLRDVAVELGVLGRDQDGKDGKDGEDPFAIPLGTRRLIEQLGIDRFEQFGILTDAKPAALREGLGRLWELKGGDARSLAGALAQGRRFAHLLRFAHTDPKLEDGGYSVVVVG